MESTATQPRQPLPKSERPTSYPAVGDRLQHSFCDQTGAVLRVDPHSNPRNTRQRAITIRTNNGREVVFELSVSNFWFNWKPAQPTEGDHHGMGI